MKINLSVVVTNEDIAELIKSRTGLEAEVQSVELSTDGLVVTMSNDPAELTKPSSKPNKAEPKAKKQEPAKAEEPVEEVAEQEDEPVEEAKELPKKPAGGIFGAAAKKKEEDAPSETATKSEVTKNIFGGLAKK